MTPPSRAQATDRRLTPLVLRSAVVAALGGLLFGFDTAVISGTTKSLTEVFDLSGFGLGFTVATALIGTIIGALSAGQPANRFGRKKVLLVIGVLYFVSAIGSAVVSDWYLFMLFRFLGGIGVGAASVVAPIYTTEISPARQRGRLVGLVQFNVVLGILLAYVSNWVIATWMAGDVAWRWMFGIEAVPALVFFALVFTVPESPRWLYIRGMVERSRQVLARLTSTEAELEAEFAEMEKSARQEREQSSATLFTSSHRRTILLAVAIAAFNQLSGINAVLYYAPDIFTMAGASGDVALLQSIAVGLVNLLATMAALFVIDRFGRRRLMLVGSIGYLVSLGAIALVFLTGDGQFGPGRAMVVLAGLVVFIASHAFGQGAVIWVFIAEIFPTKVRAQGQALGSFVHWFFAAVTSWTFPGVAASLGGGVAFLAFFLFMVLQLVWVVKIMPETKQVPLEEMADTLSLPRTQRRS
ncbi:sugar porter family MFS transporter [Kocuria sp.]|uniref:sugar porter family MFS transporter n=1 Tax=Kocuria sp. TaxID=1871328 RepID=UPI0026DBB6D3|nr:sugar porter family MFS transporter [Kocuria sp.]MDO4918618.1 sugar porter family MFS transporter [Kocuria sp.]